MKRIKASVRDYENLLKNELGSELVADDLDEKHDKMNHSAFVFLRATYWRWAELAPEVCGALMDDHTVLSVGDVHLENFGTWRDDDGRLIWGVNDFDEAAPMPYSLDLVRLAASAILAKQRNTGPSSDQICAAIAEGYSRGLDAPSPIVLEREHKWLREQVVVSDKKRDKFWAKLAGLEADVPPGRFAETLASALPEGTGSVSTHRRMAGTGSLGRPRWVANGIWRGGPVVREAKALLPSGWLLSHAPHNRSIYCGEAAGGPNRALDPWYNVTGRIVVRRLSPNNRKIEVEDDADILLDPVMLGFMGFELANIHTASADSAAAIRASLPRNANQLAKFANVAADAVENDWRDWKS